MDEGGYRVPDELVEATKEMVEFLSSGGVIVREMVFDKNSVMIEDVIRRIEK